MAQHGYAREYDQDFDRGDDRERAWRDRGWDDGNWRDRQRSFMFGDENRDYRSREQGFGRAVFWDERPSGFSGHPDDHYRSWRQKQIDALDRDYAEYCREREQQFHEEFDSWRSQRHSNPQPLQTGMTQTSLSQDPGGELELTNEMPNASQNKQDAIGTATLGTTSGGRTRK